MNPSTLEFDLAEQTLQVEAAKAAAALLTALTAWKKEWPGYPNFNDRMMETVSAVATIARGS